jgi:hypothetical protein
MNEAAAMLRGTKRFQGLTALVLAIVVLLLSSMGTAEKLGGAPDPFLDSIGIELEDADLDYLTDWKTKEALKARRRPALAPLQGFPSAAPGETTKKWMKDFTTGVGAALLGYKAEVTNSLPAAESDDPEDFLAKWLGVERSRRVFISFSREDAKHAQAVRSILEASGYRVFTYIQRPDEEPPFDPHVVGKLFDNAGHRYVIDSEAARRSLGVYFEAAIAPRLARPEAPTTSKPPAHVYGRMNCHRTQDVIMYLENRGVNVVFHDIATSKRATYEVARAKKVGWIPNSALPAVKVSGRFVDMTTSTPILEIEEATRGRFAAKPSAGPPGSGSTFGGGSVCF